MQSVSWVIRFHLKIFHYSIFRTNVYQAYYSQILSRNSKNSLLFKCECWRNCQQESKCILLPSCVHEKNFTSFGLSGPASQQPNSTICKHYPQNIPGNRATQVLLSKYITPPSFGVRPYTDMTENRYAADYARLGTSGCKKCKQKIEKGGFRIAKLVSNPFSDDGKDMKQYHHASCIFETFLRARSTTKIIEDPDDLEGYTDLKQEDKDLVKKLISDCQAKRGSPKKGGKKPAAAVQSKLPGSPVKTPKKEVASSGASTSSSATSGAAVNVDEDVPIPVKSDDPRIERDNSFRQFRRLCADIAEENSYNGKTALVAKYLAKGNSGDGFLGDIYLLMKLLLPGVVKTVYNLNNKQLVKIFSQVFGTNLEAMQEDLEQGDVAETVRVFFEQSKVLPAEKKSTLTLQEVDALLTQLSKFTKEDDQQRVLTKIAKRSTPNDLKMVVRLIKHDLRINAGAKHILEGLDSNAYEAFQASRNLRDVVDRVLELKQPGDKPGLKKKLSIRANLMTPVLPMLAEACKSVAFAFKRCTNGMYAEIKYDGERVQVHKQGDTFSYFSRSLKPVLPHKVQHFKEFIPKAFPHGNDLILDSEVLMIDTKTGNPLPFGTLGIHKKQAFKDANVCLFIFDCLHFNGENLMDRPIKERRKFLRENMTEVPNRILFSEMKHITVPGDLRDMMVKVFEEGLEGLVLKDTMGVYEPGKRHWLKVKKDYLAEGIMADGADLIVLGAYYGSGNKGGMMSVFLMGCHDPITNKFCTVTKCSGGFDDKTLEKLQKELDDNMVKVKGDYSKVPGWLKINRNVTPDFIVQDPKSSPVWEIVGAEFSKSESHTANGISIRFPRCTKMRDDKTWKEATNLQELELIFKNSKQRSDFDEILGGSSSKKKGGKSSSNGNSDAESNGSVKMEVSDVAASNHSSSVKPSPMKTPIKRKAEKEDDGTPVKKEKGEKPICKYGAGCYQKSPDHREKYHHPSGSASSHPGASPSKHLPDVFRGMKFHLPDSIDKAKQLKRYIVAFDGDVVPDYKKDEATHIVVGSKKEVTSNSHVTVDWLWECVKKKKLIPVPKSL